MRQEFLTKFEANRGAIMKPWHQYQKESIAKICMDALTKAEDHIYTTLGVSVEVSDAIDLIDQVWGKIPQENKGE